MIVRIYSEMFNGAGEHGEFSKIFNRTDFGYREIRVERPLRLNFQATPEHMIRLANGSRLESQRGAWLALTLCSILEPVRASIGAVNEDRVHRVMSSISRRRNGLMALSVMGGLLSWVRSSAPRSQDRTPASATPRDPSLAANYRGSGLVVCPACSIAWGWKSLIRPDGGEGLAKHKGGIARWRLKAVQRKTAA